MKIFTLIYPPLFIGKTKIDQPIFG